MKYIIKSPSGEIMPFASKEEIEANKFRVKLNRTKQKHACWQYISGTSPFIPYTQSVQTFKLRKATINVQGKDIAINAPKKDIRYFRNISAKDLSIVIEKLSRNLYRNVGKLYYDLLHGAKPIKRVDIQEEARKEVLA